MDERGLPTHGQERRRGVEDQPAGARLYLSSLSEKFSELADGLSQATGRERVEEIVQTLRWVSQSACLVCDGSRHHARSEMNRFQDELIRVLGFNAEGFQH